MWGVSAAAIGLVGAAMLRYIARHSLVRDIALRQPPPRAWEECVRLGNRMEIPDAQVTVCESAKLPRERAKLGPL
jgi:hypothetical protein